MITFNHDYETTYSKVYIQFTSNGEAGEITFQIRYYGSSYNKNIKFLFFSRVVSGKQNNTFNHAIFDVNSAQYQNQIIYFEDINLNQNKIINLQDPINNNDAATKGYIDQKVSNHDFGDYLKRDGSKAMTGNLNMDDNNILSVENLTDYKEDDPLPVRVKDLKSVVNKEYLNTKFLKKDKNDNNFDLKQNIITNCEPYYDGLFDDNSLVSKAFVDAEISKLPKPETDVLKLDGSKAMIGSLNMNNHPIIGIGSSSADNAALTVGGAKENYLTLLGDSSMKGNLNMGNFTIRNIKPFVEDDSSQEALDAQKNEVINFGYFHTQRGELTRLINGVALDALNRKNPDPMQDNIDMANHSIINLKDPQVGDNTHAATVNFVQKTISDSNAVISTMIDKKIKESETSSIDLVDQENVFKRVMDNDEFKEDDDDIHKVGVKNKDFHLVNKKTYEFKIDYDSAIGYYTTRLSIDLLYLPVGSYTMVFEMYVEDGITIDEIEGSSGTLSGVTTKSNIDGTKTRSIIHFSYNGLASGFNDLDIDIKLKSKTNPKTTIYVVVYGVKSNVNNVSVGLWDRLYYYDNDSIEYEVPIDMKGKKIKGVGDGTSNSDAVNKTQLDALDTRIQIALDTLTKFNYYFFTNDLKHNDEKIVKFPKEINYGPFRTVSDDNTKLRITENGNYNIIYYDQYKGNGKFNVYDATNNKDLFIISINTQSSWSPLTINFIVPINANADSNIDIQLKIFGGNGILDGERFSTFFIKWFTPASL